MTLTRRCFALSSLALAACGPTLNAQAGTPPGPPPEPGVKGLPPDPALVERLVKTEDEWKALLDSETRRILRDKGTERAFTGRYWDNHARGEYFCAGCGLHLFASGDKFDSGTGWPSFTRPFAQGRVQNHSDTTLGMVRVEVTCARCGGHLGHVFDDGPAPTGERYCMNGQALIFRAT